MKLTVEIKDNNFSYDYAVGESRASGSMPLVPENLTLFTNILNACNTHTSMSHKQKIEEINARCYIQEHPDLLQKYLGNTDFEQAI